VVRKQRVKPWWKADPSGQIVMSIKFGARAIEFEKGKAGVAVPSKDKLPGVIDTLMQRSGPVSSMTTLLRLVGSGRCRVRRSRRIVLDG
jgi:hypothetical protein